MEIEPCNWKISPCELSQRQVSASRCEWSTEGARVDVSGSNQLRLARAVREAAYGSLPGTSHANASQHIVLRLMSLNGIVLM